MESYYRDILIYKKTENGGLIINRDRAEEVGRAAADFTSGAVSNIIKVILEAERRFFFSVNFRLAVEKMFFDILEEKNRWKKS
jgi:DNA polymerase III gamma/tau subunit